MNVLNQNVDYFNKKLNKLKLKLNKLYDEENFINQRYQMLIDERNLDWKELYEWCEEFRKKNNLFIGEFLLKWCNREPTFHLIKCFKISKENYIFKSNEILDAVKNARKKCSEGNESPLFDREITELQRMVYCFAEFFYFDEYLNPAYGNHGPFLNENGLIEMIVINESSHKQLNKEDIINFFEKHGCKAPSVIKFQYVTYL